MLEIISNSVQILPHHVSSGLTVLRSVSIKFAGSSSPCPMYLDETDGCSLLTECLTAHVDPILSNNASLLFLACNDTVDRLEYLLADILRSA